MAAPLVWRRLTVSALESVDELAELEQITESAEIVDIVIDMIRGRPLGIFCAAGGPARRNERAAAVGQDDEQEQDAAPTNAADDGQRPAIEGVAFADDRHLIRDITAMGSVTMLPSTKSVSHGWFASSSIGSVTRASSA
jgi:hypothetical protein